jgi:hypothetical protein
MIVFDPIILGSLLVLASSNPSCDMPKPTEIDVLPVSSSVKYDYSKRLKDIQNQAMTTSNPYGDEAKSYTQGFMKGLIKIEPEVSLGYMRYTRSGLACIWYDKINIEISVKPTIVIGREIYKDKCMKSAVITHEKKHVNADRKIVNKYSKIMGREVYKAIKSKGFKSSIIKSSEIKNVRDEMNQIVFNVVNSVHKNMEKERVRVQQAIDTREEYKYVASKCPNFDPTKYLSFKK